MLATAYRLTGSLADAEDVIQDLFVGLPAALARYDERGSFSNWLRRAAVRLALMRMRSSMRRREWSLELADTMVGAPPAEVGQTREALAALTAEDRTIVILKIVEGYGHSEIAELLGIKKGTAEVRLHRALTRLREHLEEMV